MYAFFVSNKSYDVDKLRSHATNRLPGLIHITPGYVTEDGMARKRDMLHVIFLLCTQMV
jgi:hypothetical protein